MTNYDYYQAVREDVHKAILEEYKLSELTKALNADPRSFKDFCEELEDNLWIRDSVTGASSGTYTHDWRLAAENLLCNWCLMVEALTAWGCTLADMDEGPEFCDIIIRRYLLPRGIVEALKLIQHEIATDTLVLPDTAPDQD